MHLTQILCQFIQVNFLKKLFFFIIYFIIVKYILFNNYLTTILLLSLLKTQISQYHLINYTFSFFYILTIIVSIMFHNDSMINL